MTYAEKLCMYSAQKAYWIARNPQATPEQIEAECRRIAERLGV
jgi:hypothetical protein